VSAPETLILDSAAVRELLPMDECINAMEGAFRALAEGKALLPLRSILWTPDKKGGLGLMPGYLGTTPEGLAGLKAVTVFPGNHGTELDAHQGVVLLFEAQRGRLRRRDRDHRDPNRGGKRARNASARPQCCGRPCDLRFGHAGSDAPGSYAGRSKDRKNPRVEPEFGKRASVC
jgi:hypothetical protein